MKEPVSVMESAVQLVVVKVDSLAETSGREISTASELEPVST